MKLPALVLVKHRHLRLAAIKQRVTVITARLRVVITAAVMVNSVKHSERLALLVCLLPWA